MTNILKRRKYCCPATAQARLERAAGLAQGTVTREGQDGSEATKGAHLGQGSWEPADARSP